LGGARTRNKYSNVFDSEIALQYPACGPIAGEAAASAAGLTRLAIFD
jgi:hypothetical protein